MLKLKLQYFCHLIRRADSFEKTLMLGKIEGRRHFFSSNVNIMICIFKFFPECYFLICLNNTCLSLEGKESCLQFFPASGSFQMSQFFTSGGKSTGVSASTPALPMNIQDWFPLGWTGWISLQSKGLSRVLSNITVQKHQFKKKKASILQCSAFFIVQHPHVTIGKTISSTRWTFVGKVMSLLFNMLSRLVITFLSRSKCLLISWL